MEAVVVGDPLPLPEDPSRWPEDPWQVLGLARTADRRDVRRAYARLIRLYKPEHKPVEFRLVRDAYERIDGYLEFRDATGLELAIAPQEGDPCGDLVAGDEHAAFQQPGAAEECEIDRLWKQASASPEELSVAYHALAAVPAAQQGDEELCLRLYWLLRLWPHLDPAADCSDWLVRGMRSGNVGGRLMELYWRHVQRKPEDALGDRMKDLLNSAPSVQRCGALLAMRWQAASLVGRRDVIAGDLAWAKQRILPESQEAWVRLLLEAMNHLAWETKEPAYGFYLACRREVASHTGEHIHLEGELDRSDLLDELAKNWKRMRYAPTLNDALVRPLATIIEQSWTQPFCRIRPPLLKLLASWLAAPEQAMDNLDRLGPIAPLVVHRLAFLVDAIYRDRSDLEQLPPVRALRDEVQSFLWIARRETYEQSRCRVLAFCFRKQITAEQFAEALGEIMPHEESAEGLQQCVGRDIVLRLLSAAALSVWPVAGAPSQQERKRETP